MRIRPAHLLLCGALLLAPVAACGKDSKKDTTTDASSTTIGSSGTVGGSSNNELVQYCKDVDKLVTDAQAAISSHSQADLQSLQTRSQELAARGQTISKTATAADVPELQACSKHMSDLLQQIARSYGATTG